MPIIPVSWTANVFVIYTGITCEIVTLLVCSAGEVSGLLWRLDMCRDTSTQHVRLHRAGLVRAFYGTVIQAWPGNSCGAPSLSPPRPQPDHWTSANVISWLMCRSTAVEPALLNGMLVLLGFSQWSELCEAAHASTRMEFTSSCVCTQASAARLTK